MEAFVQKLLKLDVQQVPLFLIDSLRNPANNPRAFILIIAAITLVLAVIILVLVLVFMSSDAEEDEYEYEDDDDVEKPDAAEPVEEKAPVAPPSPARRLPGYVLAGIWTVLFAVVWVSGGYLTSQETTCMSCHATKPPHVARAEGGKTAAGDPHRSVDCVSCHETPNQLASVTTAFPGRAVHFILGAVAQSSAAGYGTPVANRSCASCHEESLDKTTTNQTRGIRVSHKEPLAAKARCIDCHEPHEATGAVDRFTVGMDACLRCHDAEAASANCELCHTKDTGYAVQSRGAFKARAHDAQLDCGSCHEQSRCDSCHGLRMPHSTAFMGAGHARAGAEDIWYNGGKTCGRCHTGTRRPCARCHKAPFPGHAPSYMKDGHKTADPYNNGCDQCHKPLAWVNGRNFCGNCHPEYASAIQR